MKKKGGENFSPKKGKLARNQNKKRSARWKLEEVEKD